MEKRGIWTLKFPVAKSTKSISEAWYDPPSRSPSASKVSGVCAKAPIEMKNGKSKRANLTRTRLASIIFFITHSCWLGAMANIIAT
jgi:hypothetical protein